MRFSQDDLFQLVEFVWSSVLQREICESDKAFTPDDSDRTMAASVMISGTWSGALVLTCQEELARIVACTMFGTEDDRVSDDDVRDALGELANMVGGNVKSLLPDGCHLSLPTVADGRTLSLKIRGSETESDTTYATGEYLFRVTILKNAKSKFAGTTGRESTAVEVSGV